MGNRLTEIESPQGFAAESSGASVILASSYFGYPLSTTHVVCRRGRGLRHRQAPGLRAMGDGRPDGRRMAADHPPGAPRPPPPPCAGGGPLRRRRSFCCSGGRRSGPPPSPWPERSPPSSINPPRPGRSGRCRASTGPGGMMARPITLFTGQWADLTLDDLAGKAASFGFEGLELACWGDHFEVDRALAEPDYAAGRRELLERHGLGCWSIGNHLVGPGRLRSDRRAPPRASCRPRSGATATRGRAHARRRADEGHRARRRGVRRPRSSPASPARPSGTSSTPSRPTTGRRSSAATRTSPSAGGRSSTSSTPRACASRSRSTRPRSPTTS